MVADIERAVIYDVTVPGIDELYGETRTQIEAGDDGFVEIAWHEEAMPSVFADERRGHTYLTPPMIEAIVKWYAGRKAARAVAQSSHG